MGINLHLLPLGITLPAFSAPQKTVRAEEKEPFISHSTPGSPAADSMEPRGKSHINKIKQELLYILTVKTKQIQKLFHVCLKYLNILPKK